MNGSHQTGTICQRMAMKSLLKKLLKAHPVFRNGTAAQKASSAFELKQ